jgi:hypothetical protein
LLGGNIDRDLLWLSKDDLRFGKEVVAFYGVPKYFSW